MHHNQYRPSRFAPVAPIQILEEMSFPMLGNYHLFLAHHTVEHDHANRFRDLVLRFTQRDRQFVRMNIIMDNSIVELGGAVDDQMIYDSVRACATPDTCVIPCLPDVMGSAADTLDLSAQAYDRWDELGMQRLSGAGYMIVTQAATKQELITFCDHFFVQNRNRYKNITWVGIPRYMLKQGWESRKWAIRYIQMVAPWVKIHLLGFSDDILTDMFDAREIGVQGIDSAVPVRHKGPLWTTTTEYEIGPRDPDWMEAGKLNKETPMNLERVRQWIDRTQALQHSIKHSV